MTVTSAAAPAAAPAGSATRLAYEDAEPVATMWLDAEQTCRRLGVGREAMLDRGARSAGRRER